MKLKLSLLLLVGLMLFSLQALAQSSSFPPSSGGSGSTTIVACVGTPGNTAGTYQKSLCQDGNGAIYACNNPSNCTVAADWVPQPYTALAVVRTGSTVLTIGPNCSASAPCRVRVGTTVYSITASATATITAGTGTAYVWVDNNGALQVGSNVTITCASCTSSVATAFPVSNAFPLATWTATTATWDSSGGTDYRSFFGINKPLINGTGILFTDVAGSLTIAYDPTVNVATATALAALPTPCSAGAAPTGIIANGNSTGCTSYVQGPGTVTSGNVPTWNGTTGLSLGAGLGVASANTNSAIVQRDSSGNINVSNVNGAQILASTLTDIGFRIRSSAPTTSTCTSSAATVTMNSSVNHVSLNNQSTCAVTVNTGSTSEMAWFVVCNGASTATTSLSWVGIKGAPTTTGTTSQCTAFTAVWDTVNSNWYVTGAASTWN